MPFPYAVVGGLGLGYAIYKACKSDDDYDDDYYVSSGPSAEELQEQALEKLLEEAQRDFSSFFSSYENVRIIPDSDDFAKLWYTTEAIFSSTHQEDLISCDDFKKIRSNTTVPDVREDITSDSLENFCECTEFCKTNTNRLAQRIKEIVHVGCPALDIQEKVAHYLETLCDDIGSFGILPSDDVFSIRKNYNTIFKQKQIFDYAVKKHTQHRDNVALTDDEQSVLNAYAKKDAEFQEYFMQFVNLQNIKASNPRIAVCGLLKAGKSSLLNMLTENYADEYFKTAKVRETVATKILTYNGIDYVDTPGLDAPESDEAESWKTFISADIILFVHELGSELKSEEIKILEKLYRENKECAHSIVFVFTYADNFAKNESDLQRIERVICEQITKTIHVSPVYFSVSNTSYRKGVLEHKKNLSEKIGRVQLLMQYIASQKSNLTQNASQNRKRQKEIVFSKMSQCINKATLLAKQPLEDAMSSELKQYQDVLNRVERLKNLYAKKRNDITNA